MLLDESYAFMQCMFQYSIFKDKTVKPIGLDIFDKTFKILLRNIEMPWMILECFPSAILIDSAIDIFKLADQTKFYGVGGTKYKTRVWNSAHIWCIGLFYQQN